MKFRTQFFGFRSSLDQLDDEFFNIVNSKISAWIEIQGTTHSHFQIIDTKTDSTFNNDTYVYTCLITYVIGKKKSD